MEHEELLQLLLEQLVEEEVRLRALGLSPTIIVPTKSKELSVYFIENY